MDNIILGHEVIHSLKTSGMYGMLIKLDLSKDFDRLRWKYICSILLAFGFNANWVQWIMNLTSSTFFSILVNDVPSFPLSLMHGICQGDPLSPFVFVIMVGGLIHYIKEAIEEGSLKGLPLHGLQPPICHGQFVDKTLMTNSPTVLEARCILNILNDFSVASGTSFNTNKSQKCFFNTPWKIQDNITKIIHFTQRSLPSKYLGIPLIDTILSNSSWEELLATLEKRLNFWTFWSLNLPILLVHIKYVLQVIPLYNSSMLSAPKFILKYIRNIQRNFLWKGTKEGHKWDLVSL